MTTLREAAQQALEAMETVELDIEWRAASPTHKMLSKAITALRAALAEPVQEPVAWRTFDGEGGYDYWAYEDNENYHKEYVKRNGEKYASWVEPLYTAPPQRKPLTIERLRDALVASRIIPPAAVEDPDEYDDGVTLFRIEALHRRIT